jgi:hypothetical protein
MPLRAIFEADADQLSARSGQVSFIHVDELALFAYSRRAIAFASQLGYPAQWDCALSSLSRACISRHNQDHHHS